VLIQDVLTDKFRSSKLLPTQRTQIFVLSKFLRIYFNKLLNFSKDYSSKKTTTTTTTTDPVIAEVSNVAANDILDTPLNQSQQELSVKDKLFQCFTLWTVPKKAHEIDPLLMEEESSSDPIFLPAVHSIAPSRVQSSIFIRQIHVNLREMTKYLDISMHVVLPELIHLAKSFRLTKDTIVFRPDEWKVILSVMIARWYINLFVGLFYLFQFGVN
jgi:hypothetical protein